MSFDIITYIEMTSSVLMKMSVLEAHLWRTQGDQPLDLWSPWVCLFRSVIAGGGAEEGSHPSHIMDYNVGHGGEDDDGVVKFETGDLGESSEDDIPSLEKSGLRRKVSMERFSDLPRRQSSYRVAKNLDAVSRKAMMMYKTSEVYSEQIAVRRKRVSHHLQMCVC